MFLYFGNFLLIKIILSFLSIIDFKAIKLNFKKIKLILSKGNFQNIKTQLPNYYFIVKYQLFFYFSIFINFFFLYLPNAKFFEITIEIVYIIYYLVNH